ncbi:serine/threonine protein kinase [Murinocardiopsis flavida]|uniref:non-specific serine/threonine protein kinase n=1 Tax=Murinocardiopsis flavida TaxID=645275 RepID=A0A2P8DPB6_9ACTN|nr:serine/threonine-protein kinase [Murinocardiopsis flavida]PSK99058.1 serine/threonine protein kinase [Murinocardiopsis flavida]
MGPLEHGDPERIGRYRLIGRLGAGGMGQVYFGRSAGGRAVAIKRIHPHMAADPSFRQRFAREVAAARQVSGAFTAPVIDADPESEVPWLVTSYVPSLPLDEAVHAHGPLPEPTLRVLAAGLAEALTEIHRVGLIHRDLKPGNVLLAEDGPRVIDFGIARATEGTAATQSIIGTPGFMSPEQIQGAAMTPRSDIFAFGAVMVHAAGGVGPFGEGAMHTMVMRIMQHEPDISAVPPSLQRMVAACLAKDERRRPGPGDVLDYLGDVPISESWLPPAMARGVQEQIGTVNAALSGAPATGADTGGRTSAFGAAAAGAVGGAAAGAAAAGMLGDDQATRAGGQYPTAVNQGATSVDPYAAGQHTAGAGATSVDPYAAGQHTAGAGATSVDPYAAGQRTAGGDAYSDLYGGARRDDPRRAREQREQEEARQREEERRRESREREEREEQRRRQEAERAHQERIRAERSAARRAQSHARSADQPGVWGFVKLLPLLIIPIAQIPLGYAAAYGWQWFTSTELYWDAPWYAPEFLSAEGFYHALMLGYFLFNNLVTLEYLVRSMRTGFVTGIVLAAIVIVGTNAALWNFGFFG